MPYEVSTPVFEGPFDLLLHLITKEQVDIYQVSLSAIVDGYISTLDQMRTVDLNTATEFLLIAAVLLELKARRLLPGSDDVASEEELALWEERDLLLARLFECKTFKDAASALHRMMDVAGRSFPRLAGLEERFLALRPDLLAGVGPDDIHRAYLRAVTPRTVPRVDIGHLAPIRITVTDAVDELVDELPRTGPISFGRLTAGLVERVEVIVRFLAVLELYKRGWIELEQLSNVGQLTVTWLGTDGDGAEPVAIFPVEEYQG